MCFFERDSEEARSLFWGINDALTFAPAIVEKAYNIINALR